jgi:hypothetical protein
MDLDGCVRACYRTQAATDTPGRIVNHREKVASLGNLLGHRQYALGTGFDAKLTSLAVIFINCNSGHFYIPLGLTISVNYLVFSSHGFSI